jgi:hypothetical protein
MNASTGRDLAGNPEHNAGSLTQTTPGRQEHERQDHRLRLKTIARLIQAMAMSIAVAHGDAMMNSSENKTKKDWRMPTDWIEEVEIGGMHILIGYNFKLKQKQIMFTKKPSKSCIKMLKDEGWSWHDKDRVWHKKCTASDLERYTSHNNSMNEMLIPRNERRRHLIIVDRNSGHPNSLYFTSKDFDFNTLKNKLNDIKPAKK